MKKRSLDKVRKEIGEKDREIVRLLNERASLSIEVGRIKNLEGMDIYDPVQESKVINGMSGLNTGPLSDGAIREIYRDILSSSRAMQASPVFACLGPEASFTHLAALSHFGRSAKIELQKTIGQVFDEAEKGKVTFGIVPLENSLEGSVKLTLDRLITTPLKIRAEIFLRVSHCLMSACKRKTEMKRIYSHPQALAQCQGWLARHLAHAVPVETDSTAAAVLKALEDAEGGAIGSRLASEIHALPILDEGIEDHPSNTTRFIVIGEGVSHKSEADKTSILFGTPHVPGALYLALGPFAKAEINLLRIESHPIRNRMWEYLFFVDFAGHGEEEKVKKCLQEMRKKTAFMKVLGSYPRGEEE